MAGISRKEKKEVEAWVHSLYQNVLDIKIEINPEDSSKLLVRVIRGVELPPIDYTRKED